MIRFFLLMLACMAGAWWLAEAIRDYGPGYVYLQLGAYTLETSAWFGFLLLAALVAGFYVMIRLASWVFYHLVMVGRLPGVFFAGRARKQHRQALLAFLGEDWGKAAKKLGKLAGFSGTPFPDYVMAARASLAAQDSEAARRFTDLARGCADADRAVVALLQLDVACLQAGPLQQQFLLEKMLVENGNTPGLLGRAIAIYSRDGEWQKLDALMPAIRRNRLLDEQRWQALQQRIAAGKGTEPRPANAVASIQALWKKAVKAVAGLMPANRP